MKNVFKNPLKLIAVGMFVVAMGFGVSTSLKVSVNNGNVDLLALSSAVAQGESGGGGYHIQIVDCPNCAYDVIRCRTGGSGCSASMQIFCDENPGC